MKAATGPGNEAKGGNQQIFSGAQAISKKTGNQLENEPDNGRECIGKTVHAKEAIDVANAPISRRLFPEAARIE